MLLVSDTIVLTIYSYISLPNTSIRFKQLIFWHRRADESITFVHIHYNWGEPEQAPYWLKSVMVLYVACTDCENDKIWLTSHSSFVMVSYVACTDSENAKIRLTSHSSFVMVSYVACTDCENDKIRWTSYSTFHMSRVQTVSVEGSMK